MNPNTPQKPRLAMPLEPWQQGYDSRPWEECPYPVDSVESWAWSAGRIEGQAVVEKTGVRAMDMKSVFFRYAGDEEYSQRIGVADSEQDAIEAVKYHCRGVDDDPYRFEVKDRKEGFYVTLERVL